jgi:hypothetical protein
MGTKIAVNEYTKFEGHKQGVYALLWLESERCLLSAGGDGALVKWDLASIQPQVPVTGKLYAQLPEPVFCAMLAENGVIWAGTQGGCLFLLTPGMAPKMLKLATSAVFFVSRWMENGYTHMTKCCCCYPLCRAHRVVEDGELMIISIVRNYILKHLFHHNSVSQVHNFQNIILKFQ